MSAAKALPWIIGFLLATGLTLAWFGNTPLFGDELGYSYSAASWIERNSLAPVPSGDGKGEQGMGHPALYFWLWAVLMRVFGDTITTARILPTISAGFSIVGVWMLGKQLSGSAKTGLMAVTGLLASPLFLAQGFRAIPECSHLACVAWSLYFFTREDRLKAAIFAVLATIFRQQGVFLGAAFLLADILKNRRFRPGMLLWLSPLLVPLVNGLIQMKVNGYFFFPTYMGHASPDLPTGWFPARIGLFAGHLMGEDFRWFPLAIALAWAFIHRDSKPGILFLAALALPALFHPPTRLIVIVGFLTLFAVLLLKRKRMPSPPVTAMLAFIGMLVAFHVLIVAVAPDPQLDLFRYIFGGYAPLMVLLAIGVRRTGKRISAFAWAVFCLASFSCITVVRYTWQPDASVAGLLEARAVRSAMSAVTNPCYPDDRIAALPALGYVSTPVPFEGGAVLNLVLTTADIASAESLLPEGYRFTGRTTYNWTLEGLSVVALEAERR